MKYIWCCVIVFLLIGCGPVYRYQYKELDYIPTEIYNKPLDMYDYRHREIINVYVPRYRPLTMYSYGGIYYSEPYTTVLYRDLNGRVGPRKVPDSVLRKMHRQHNPSPRTAPQNIIKKQRQQRENFFKSDQVDQRSDRKLNRQRTRNR